jgi:thioesterase domain-containing protein/acyl carrier protein
VVARSLGSESSKSSDSGAAHLVAFVEATGNEANANWRQNLAKRLPDHMIPSRVVTLPKLPLLPNGKVNRRQLRDMALAPEARGREGLPIVSTRKQTLISLWEGLLGRTGIGLNDNFFELGGHSLLVVEMTLAIERDFGVTLSAADVFENPTVEELARRIEHRGGSVEPPYQHLFPIQPAGRGMPFIIAVPHFFTQMFAARFRGERPVYGLRGVSLRPEGNRGRWRTMTDLGEDLVQEIRRRFPDETCIMAGYSFGASMAIEAVRVMERLGMTVHRLYLIAPMPEDFYRFGPFRVQIDGLRKPVEEVSVTEALRLYARGNNPLTRRPYRRAWRWFAIEPWRRLLCGIGRLRKQIGMPLTPRILHADVRVERFRLHAQYRPGFVHTPTVIFNAKDAETDAAATWRPYFKGPFTVHETPDPHLDEASVEAACQVILRHLQDVGDA